MKIGGITITRDQVTVLLTGPKVQAFIRWVIGPAGWVGIKLAHWFGFNVDQLGDIATYAIYALPFAIQLGWALYDKVRNDIRSRAPAIQQAIIERAAQILADRHQATIVVNPSAPPAPAKEKLLSLAKSEYAPAVVMAGTGEAKMAAVTGKPS